MGVSPLATAADEPSQPELVDALEHALMRIAHPLRWIWQRPHVAH